MYINRKSKHVCLYIYIHISCYIILCIIVIMLWIITNIYIYICCCEIFEAARPFCCSGKCVSIQQFSAGTHCVGSPYNLPKPLKGRDREWRRKRLEDEINGAVQSFRTQMTHAGNCCCEIFEAARPFCCSGKCVSIQQFSAGTHCVGSPYNLPLCTKYL